MSTALRLTVDQYDTMVAAGAFANIGSRVELIYGELREMSPQGPPHTRALTYLTRWSIENTKAGEVDVRVQMPVAITEFDSEPEPDLVWSKPLTNNDAHPCAADVMLLIEVGDATLRNDLREKARLYARAAVADYWVIDLPTRSVHTFREPSSQGFALRETLRQGYVYPLAFPHVQLSVDELFQALL